MHRNRSIAAATLLLLSLAGCGGSEEAGPDEPAATTPAAFKSFPAGDEFVALEPGVYRVPRDGVVTGYDVTVPAGWGVEHGEILTKNPGSPDAIAVEVWALSEVTPFDDACRGKGVLGAPPADAAKLAAALRAQKSGPRVGKPEKATFAGLAASRVTLTASDEDLSDCRVPGHLQVWNGFLTLVPGEVATLDVVGTDEHQQVFVSRVADEATDADRRELKSILDSVRIRES